jgi:20S proteasome alpha/beta subunit
MLKKSMSTYANTVVIFSWQKGFASEEETMTLAFALRGTNGLVLGADSRVTSLEGTADTSTKFLQVNREVGVLTYGLAEVGYKATSQLVDEVNRTSEFNRVRKKRVVHFSEIAEKADSIFKQSFTEWIDESKKNKIDLQPDDPKLSTGFILGGFDLNETNQFKVLLWQSPRFQREERQDVLAAQWIISQYLVNHFYYFEMNVDQLKRLAVFLLVETEMISPSVGGPLQIATVTLENGFQRLSEKDVRDLIDENQARFADFRRILLDKLG